MDESIKGRLTKLFEQGISFQDFKAVSSFGFNLFICNILAKKLYCSPQFQSHASSEDRAGGIQFTSHLGKGSVFYFDINLKDERVKPINPAVSPLLDDSYLPLVLGIKRMSQQQQQQQHQFPSDYPDFKTIRPNELMKSHIFITNSRTKLKEDFKQSSESEEPDHLMNECNTENQIPDDVPDEQSNAKGNKEKEPTDTVISLQPTMIV